MDLIIVSATDPFNEKSGGTRTYILNLINSMLAYNINVTLVGTTNNKNINSPIKLIPVMDKEITSGYKFLYYLLLKTPLLKLPKKSIIHTQRPDMMLPFVLFNSSNVKICTLHGLPSKGIILKKGKLVGTIYHLIEKYCLKRMDAVIAVSEDTKNVYLDMYPWLCGKIDVIPVGFDEYKFKPIDKYQARDRYNLNKEDKIILYAGRFEKEKGLDLLLQSFKLVQKKIKNAKLVLVGGGREKSNLERLAKTLDINMEFMNSVSHNVLSDIMNCADIFALTSLYESGPLVVLEALACGVPVVTTDVGRVREFIMNEEVGAIVERNKDDFAKAIVHLIMNDASNNQLLCRQSVIDFSFNNTTGRKTIEVYKRFMQN